MKIVLKTDSSRSRKIFRNVQHFNLCKKKTKIYLILFLKQNQNKVGEKISGEYY